MRTHKKLLMFLIVAFATCSYAQVDDIDMDSQVYEKGECVNEDSICYTVEQAKRVALFHTKCSILDVQLSQCLSKAEAVLNPSPWYNNKWLWLSVGLVAGGGAVVAACQ